jgi:HAD superfamily hydrolase (TIGR01549 family)
MLDITRIRALLFDMDGTLADTDDAYIQKVAGLIRPFHFVFPQHDPARFLRWSLMKVETPLNWLLTVPDQLGLDQPLAALTDKLQQLRGQGSPTTFMPIEGVRPMLEVLAGRYPLALVTSRDQRGVNAFVDQHQLRDYFKVVVSALSAKRIKPHPAPVLYAAEQLGVSASECVLVGDTTVDILAGRRAGTGRGQFNFRTNTVVDGCIWEMIYSAEPTLQFSIIIPTYGRLQRLANCLTALSQLKYAPDDYEVIVVDDGSPESPAPIVEAQRSVRARLIRQGHAGPAAARNLGAAAATRPYLAFTDDDCAPAPDWLTHLANGLRDNPLCAVGGQTINALSANPYSTASQALVTFMYSHFNADPQRARFFTSNNMALATDSFQAISGFDQHFPFAAGEDRDFCDRWLAKGYSLRYIPEAILYHSHGLTWRSFWQQHFNYGRGAYQFHRARALRNHAPVAFEPSTFYFNLGLQPLKAAPGRQRSLALVGLTLLSQIANAAGYFQERWQGQL